MCMNWATSLRIRHSACGRIRDNLEFGLCRNMQDKYSRQKSLSQLNAISVLRIIGLIAPILTAIILVACDYSNRNLSPLYFTDPTVALGTDATIAVSTPFPRGTLVLPSFTPQIYINQQLLTPTEQSIFTPTSSVLTNTPDVGGVIRYQVQLNDTLEAIAANNNLELKDLRAINGMVGNTLIAGQFITIPSKYPVALPPWKFSITKGDIGKDYPLSIDAGRFTLHYQPGTYPAQDPNILVPLEMDGLTFIESLTNLRLADKYDVYVAGSNFEPPGQALRGITFSSMHKTFFLHDGTGNVDDQRYISIHELTHLFMWNVVGSPSSTMLSEGVAVYFGMEMINNSEHMPIENFCAAYYEENALPKVSTPLSFLGHITDLQNYYASGCFVKYLVDTYGIESLISVYHNGDYQGVFGKNINDLESDWMGYLSTVQIPGEIDPNELIVSVENLKSDYSSFFQKFTGGAAQLDAYRELDNARIALLQGRLIEMRNFLASFNEIK
jgi:LysM repeat protein